VYNALVKAEGKEQMNAVSSSMAVPKGHPAIIWGGNKTLLTVENCKTLRLSPAFTTFTYKLNKSFGKELISLDRFIVNESQNIGLNRFIQFGD
jgi:hypothetical protein